MPLSVEREEVASAEELLAQLSPRRPPWFASNWLFRGQRDADWALQPSLLRADALERYIGRSPPTTAHGLVKLEMALIRQFVHASDRQGVAYPRGWCVPFKTIDSATDAPDPSGQPSNQLDELLGLLRHYGVPTRLLDWSTRPYCAAYFAAADAVRAENRPHKLAIWSFNITRYAALKGPTRKRGITWRDVDELAPVTSFNPNAAAQRGRFTLLRETSSGQTSPANLESLDLIVSRVHDPYQPALRCLTLDASLAEELLSLLAAEGIEGATMFPGLVGIAATVRERLLVGDVGPT